MKVGIFTDTHFSMLREKKACPEDIKIALEILKDNCDFIVCIGDLIDTDASHEVETDNLKLIKAIFDEFNLKIYVMLGNHDALCFTTEEFYGILGEKYRPHPFSLGEYRILFLNTCHYKDGSDYAVGVRDFSEAYFDDMNGLNEEMRAYSNKKKVIFSHHTIDPNAKLISRASNSDEILELLKNFNSDIYIFQGHEHGRRSSVLGNIHFETFPAMAKDKNAFFAVEI